MKRKATDVEEFIIIAALREYAVNLKPKTALEIMYVADIYTLANRIEMDTNIYFEDCAI